MELSILTGLDLTVPSPPAPSPNGPRILFAHPRATLYHGDSTRLGEVLPENSVDAIVTDPPAGIGFMSRSWDRWTTDLPDPAFLNWFAGFVDGEGCFSVHKKHVNGYETYDCQFSLSLRRDDKPILDEIHRVLRIGTISVTRDGGPNNPQARFCVSAKADCLRLVEILRAAPLRAKKALDFEIWCEALEAWINHRPKEWEDMKGARERLMASRAYTEYGKYAGSPERRGFIAMLKRALAPAYRALKPGGHGLVWALPRTSHWTAWALEDLGFEIRDRVAHLNGQGFPKSLTSNSAEIPEWSGTALKPAVEDWWLVRKPLDGTVEGNFAKWGTGLLNIDGCRIEGGTRPNIVMDRGRLTSTTYQGGLDGAFCGSRAAGETTLGRWPAHLVLDEEAAAMLDVQSGTLKSGTGAVKRSTASGYAPNAYGKENRPVGTPNVEYGDSGGASRFFYVAKGSRSEKDAGLEHLPPRTGGEATGREDGSAGVNNPRAGAGRTGGARNFHPTVKSIALMRWLCRLITPPGGIVLDPFAGSGSTGVAALAEGLRFVGCELTDEYLPILEGRIRHALTVDS